MGLFQCIVVSYWLLKKSVNEACNQIYTKTVITRNLFKKDKRRRIKKKRKTVFVHKSYTDDGKLRMIIVKDQ